MNLENYLNATIVLLSVIMTDWHLLAWGRYCGGVTADMCFCYNIKDKIFILYISCTRQTEYTLSTATISATISAKLFRNFGLLLACAYSTPYGCSWLWSGPSWRSRTCNLKIVHYYLFSYHVDRKGLGLGGVCGAWGEICDFTEAEIEFLLVASALKEESSCSRCGR